MIARVLHNYNKNKFICLLHIPSPTPKFQKFFNFYNDKIKENFTLKITICDKVIPQTHFWNTNKKHLYIRAP